MRQVQIGALITAMVGLAACAGDNPENVPLYGEWEMTTSIKSLTIDGRPIPVSSMPQQVRDLAGTEKQCGEPMFIDKDWQENDIISRISGECTFDQYDVTDTFVSGRGRCQTSAMQVDFEPIVGFSVSQSEAAYELEVILEGSAGLPGASGSRFVRAVAVQEGKRLGDC